MGHDFIIQIRDILPTHVCDKLINLFETSTHKQRIDKDGYPTWTNLWVRKHHPEVHEDLKDLIIHLEREYARMVKPYGQFFNHSPDLEGCNIKKYVGGSDDVFRMHADVSTKAGSRRFLAMLFYLNDDYTGGETVFYPDRVVTPIKGSVLIFPPYWMFPHEGKPVIEGNKYIMSTYCHWPKT